MWLYVGPAITYHYLSSIEVLKKVLLSIYLSMYGLKTRETLCIVHAQQTAVTETPR